MIARLLGRTGATAGQDFVVEDTARLGASAANDIRVAAPGVSRQHARISREGDQTWLEDAGATNGTFVNGARIAREPLRHLDIITLGRTVDLIFLFRANETAPAPVERIRNVRIEIMDGPDAGGGIDVFKGEVTLGRAPSCNVVLASPAVSKVHARLERTANQVVLQDLQSANGTYVNGLRINSAVLLNTGDLMNFGGVRSVRITIEGAAGSTPAQAPMTQATPISPPFNQEWKTRFVWAPEELEQIEAARREAVALMSVRALKDEAARPGAPAMAAARPPAAAVPPKPAAPATPSVVAKPVMSPAPVAPPPASAPAAPEMPLRPSEDAVTMPAVKAPRIRGARLLGAGAPIELGLGTFNVGRGIGCEVRLDDPQVSRAHAKIVIDASAVTVEDAGTVNGTFVNGRAVKAREPLKSGDIVQFGAMALTIEVIAS